MKFLIAALSATFIVSAYASQKIERVFEDESLMKDHITLFLSDGEIVHFKKSNTELLKKVKIAFKNSSSLLFNKSGPVSSDTADKVESFTVLSNTRKRIQSPMTKVLLDDPLDNQKLTSLDNYNSAQTLMDTLNGKTSDESQCYNRAHMWTYEASVEKEVNLGKLWIFFTHKYIKDFEYKWWFHVSPYAKVNDQNGKYVLDRGFTQVPYSITNWKNIFIKNKANCPVITDYRKYEKNQDKEFCYLLYSSQYFWQPYQLKDYATRGSLQTKYNSTDLKISYEDALITWDGEIPGIDASDNDSDTDAEPTEPPTTNDSDANPDPAPTEPTNNNANTETTTEPTNNTNSESTTIPTHNVPTSTWVSLGETVINSNGFEGKVTRVLSQYQVEVKFQNSNYSVPVNTQYLAVSRGSSFGYSVGDYIVNMHGERGKVTGIFQDGNVTVKFRGATKHYWQDPRTLTRRLMYK